MKRFFPGSPLWWSDFFRDFLCAFLCRYDATNGYRFTFGFGLRYVGHSSVLIRDCVGRFHAYRCYVGLDSVLNRPWIGVRSADICPIHNLSKTDKPPHTPVTPAKPIQNRQKPQNFQWIGQLSATDNVAEYTVKPVGFMSGSLRVRFGIESPDLRPIDNRHDTDWKPIISTMLESVTDSRPTIPNSNL